jgi:hypothetical protein
MNERYTTKYENRISLILTSPFGFTISKSPILNNDFKICDLKKVIFKNTVKHFTKSQFSL